MSEETKDKMFRAHLVELLKGGFAPVVILLREFHYEKTGIALDGLPFSAWSLLEHMRHRQGVLLGFMKNPDSNPDVWPDAHWPENILPNDEKTWNRSIELFENDMDEMVRIVENPENDLYRIFENDKSLAWAAMTAFHHNAYTIGQIKAIGRQLGVW